jgi:hypothetical protein
MVDVVRAESGPHQLLEQIRFFVRAFRRTEAGERLRSVRVAQTPEAAGRQRECFLPRRFAEVRERVRRIDLIGGALRDPGFAHERVPQTMRVRDVVEAEPALHAQPVVVGRTVAPVGADDRVAVDVVRHLTTDAAERAERVDAAVGPHGALLGCVVDEGRGHQRAGRAHLHALAAGDARRLAHRIVEVEDDLRIGAAVRHPDDVVDLDLAARALAQPTLDAGIEVDAHRRMARIGDRTIGGSEPARRDADLLRPLPERRVGVVRDRARRLIGNQQLHHHALRRDRARAGGLHLHSFARLAPARRCQDAFAVDLDHADAAVAVGPITRRGRVAEVRDRGATTLRDLPDRLSRRCFDRFSVQLELHGVTTSGKYRSSVVSGFDAAWPSPQIDASRITCESSPSSG